jgi:hypothetical protein
MAAGLLYRADRLCIFAMPPIDYHPIGLPSIEVACLMVIVAGVSQKRLQCAGDH